MIGLMTGARSDGRKVEKKLHDNPASTLSLERFDLGAMCGPKQFEWVIMNLDTRAAVNTLPLNFGPEGGRGGRFYRTASGECISDGGAWQFQGYDENGLCRSLKGRLSGVHKVVSSAGEIACKRHQDFFWASNGAFVIPMHSKIGKEMRTHCERLVSSFL